VKHSLPVVWCWLVSLTLLGPPQREAVAAEGYVEPPMPAYRVEAAGFDASQRDIRAVLDSTGRELWRYFPDYEIEPLVVTRGRQGPITLFRRNDRGEIVVKLDTGETYWCQYAYQFAHEFCHVLCGFDDDYAGNKWFEETVCETASLFAMRAMARAWKDDPPYSHWRDYRDALRSYADNVQRERHEVFPLVRHGLPEFYRLHRETLAANSCQRDLNGAMSLVMLQLFEQEPTRWEAVRWLNSAPSPQGQTFQQYLKQWHSAVPPRHREFVRQVAELYGIELTP